MSEFDRYRIHPAPFNPNLSGITEATISWEDDHTTDAIDESVTSHVEGKDENPVDQTRNAEHRGYTHSNADWQLQDRDTDAPHTTVDFEGFVAGLPPGTLDRIPSAGTETSHWSRSLESFQEHPNFSFTYELSDSESDRTISRIEGNETDGLNSGTAMSASATDIDPQANLRHRSTARHAPTDSISSWVMPHADEEYLPVSVDDQHQQQPSSRKVRAAADRILQSLKSRSMLTSSSSRLLDSTSATSSPSSPVLPAPDVGPSIALAQVMQEHLSPSEPTRTTHVAEITIAQDRRMIVETVVTQTVRMEQRIGDNWMNVSGAI